MRKLKRLITFIVLPLLSVLFDGCWSLRSAQGLSEGELNVNYIAPVAGSVRYGIHDNVEIRYVLAFENRGYDLFVHTNNKDNSFNYGLSLGGTKLNNDPTNGYGCFVISKKINDYVTPYASAFIPYKSELKRILLSEGYISLGADIRIPLSRFVTVLLTPEVGGFKGNSGGVYKGSIYATGNIGFILKLY